MEGNTQAKQPYPEIRVIRKNPVYGAMMLDNVGGELSEMSTIALYIYDHLTTGTSAQIAETFHRIAIEEMRHLEIFAELARLLGEDPRLWTKRDGQMRYWSPESIQYRSEIGVVLREAIQGEKDAIAKYSRQAYRIEDPYVVKNLTRIIEDERRHAAIFMELYKNHFTEKK